MTLKFSAEYATAAKIGPEHGLDLSTGLARYGSALQNALKTIYAKKNESGAWLRWLTLGENPGLLNDFDAYCGRVKNQFDDLVILGIGGSSLGGYAVLRALLHPNWNLLSPQQRNGFPRFHFIENVDPDQVQALLDVVDLKRTLVNVISKSGTTAETMAAFMLIKSKLEAELGPEAARKHIVATTDKSKGILRQLCTEMQYDSFEVPDDVGGRFSVFSAVGLLPAALCGINVRSMLSGVHDISEQVQALPAEQNPAIMGTLVQYLALTSGKPISVFMPYSWRLASVADWYVQLWAESLGKKTNLHGQIVNTGATPLKAVGVTDQHSQIQLYNEGPFDKIVTFIEVERFNDHQLMIPDSLPQVDALKHLANQPFSKLLASEFAGTRTSLMKNQRPSVTLTLPAVDAYSVGQLLMLIEIQTALMGALLEIDPFDQPGVELAKRYTDALMGKPGYDAERAELGLKQPASIS
ncbi:MAG: hypothetical protein VKJ06_03225 [Vampirovibrionales bacterium]|nr:hypothetical protein [Vampirovibrionales bacterium]